MFSSNRLAEKMAKYAGHRPDLQLEDSRKINTTAAHLMVSYIGMPPTTKDIMEFFSKKFENQITPCLSTARVYKDKQVITVVAQTIVPMKNYEDTNDKKKMIKVTSSLYLDCEMKEPWEVTERDGKKVLIRRENEDITNIINARKQSYSGNLSTAGKITLASVSNTYHLLNPLKKGDVIKFFNQMDGTIGEGEVQVASQSEVQVLKAGQIVKVPTHNILEVVKTQAPSQLDEATYFEKAYGDKGYANDLTRKAK